MFYIFTDMYYPLTWELYDTSDDTVTPYLIGRTEWYTSFDKCESRYIDLINSSDDYIVLMGEPVHTPPWGVTINEHPYHWCEFFLPR